MEICGELSLVLAAGLKSSAMAVLEAFALTLCKVLSSLS